MKPPYNNIFPFFATCVCSVVLAMSCLAAPDSAQATEGNAIAVINDGLNSNEGGTMISLTNQITSDLLDKSATGLHGAAWKGKKMGASSQSIGGLLEKSGGLKSASNILSTGGVLIDHAGYTSTAAGEIAGGNYTQGFITLADGLGKSVASGIGSAIGAGIGAVTGAGLGTVAGPAGTAYGGAAGGYAGGAAGGYAVGVAWDNSVAKLTSAIKSGLEKQDDKRQFREMSGPLMQGMTSEEIHEASLKHKKELNDKKIQDENRVKLEEAAMELAKQEKAAKEKAASEQAAKEKAVRSREAAAKIADPSKTVTQITHKDPALREIVIEALRGSGLPTSGILVDRLTGILEHDGESAFNKALKDIAGMQGTFRGSGLTFVIKGTDVAATFFEQTQQVLPNATTVTIITDGAGKGWIDPDAGSISVDIRLVMNGGGGTEQISQKLVGSFTGNGYGGHIAGDESAKWAVNR
ncbi:MAG: hypothetical protein PHD54_11320 [Desulfuromonadaceae bacterium]|nr:hypothetical protein [Desulfuromonadaceae bacterium]